jgi:hypothetical protein
MLIRIAVVVSFAALLSSCGGISSPSENHVDTPTGTVSSGGAGPVHTFNVDKVGEFFVTITALTPDQNIYMGIVWGQPSGAQCAPYQANNFAIRGQQALGGQIQKGSWCVQVYDVGQVSSATPTTYTLRLSYP